MAERGGQAQMGPARGEGAMQTEAGASRLKQFPGGNLPHFGHKRFLKRKQRISPLILTAPPGT